MGAINSERITVLLCLLGACDRPPETVARSDLEPAVARAPSATPPRLAEGGFERMSPAEMASPAALRRAFPALRVEVRGPSTMVVRTTHGDEVGDVDVDAGRSDRVTLEGPGIETVHGLEVGDPLAAVLGLQHRRCETVWSAYASAGGSMHTGGFVRCWVGSSRPRFRYVAMLEAPGPGIGSEPSRPAEVPTEGAALERWIAASTRRIDMIFWRRDP